MKVKANAVKQEYEKQDELKRSALKAYAALSNIPKAGKCCQMDYSTLTRKFVSFYTVENCPANIKIVSEINLRTGLFPLQIKMYSSSIS